LDNRSLRAFHQFDRAPPEFIRPVKVNGDLSLITDNAVAAVARCGTADHSVVFAPCAPLIDRVDPV